MLDECDCILVQSGVYFFVLLRKASVDLMIVCDNLVIDVQINITKFFKHCLHDIVTPPIFIQSSQVKTVVIIDLELGHKARKSILHQPKNILLV